METIAHYQVKEVIGRGGMSTVYRAYDPVAEREVAVKLMHESLSENEKAKARFSQEVQFVTALRHPTIVPALDFGEMDGRLYIVMPYLAGGSVRERLNDGPVAFDECLLILERVVAALEAAHERQIIHRDIKPHNILLDEQGWAYLSDFGVARLIDPERSGETITLIGTPEYIAPEQILGKPVSEQTDVYQLGVTAFHMLTGERPFTGSSIPQQHLDSPVPSVEAINPELPEGCDRVIWRAMAKDMAVRYPSPTAFLESLTRLKEPMAVTAFTPWSLEAATLISASSEAERAEPAEDNRVRRASRWILSLSALGAVVAMVLFFSISSLPTLEAAAEPVIQSVIEVLPEELNIPGDILPVPNEDGPDAVDDDTTTNVDLQQNLPSGNGRRGNGPGRNGGPDGRPGPGNPGP